MGGTESSTGKVIRNGDWEHQICWSESKPSVHSAECGIQQRHGSHIRRYSHVSSYCYKMSITKIQFIQRLIFNPECIYLTLTFQ